MKLTLYHLYPDLLDFYGDRGNLLTFKARCRWRDIDLQIHPVSLGENIDFTQGDILFMGGGSDREQNFLIQDLSSRAQELKQAVEDGLVVLAIGGGYQLLGKYYQTVDGHKVPGLEIIDYYTVAGSKRMIGNVIAKVANPAHSKTDLNTLVGFENHAGKTYLGSGLSPLAEIVRGYGNNGEDGLEGVRYKNVWGTYLQGPLLPKNPHLADNILRAALKRRDYNSDLRMLDDSLEIRAHKAIVKRFS
ncbi:MAG: glutamine amidotransferase [Peptococcaceae bacterium]|nr:glutamine amidotransferase [Peptococcaceae bacterium]